MEILQHRAADLPAALREPVDLLAADLDRFRRLVIDLIEISRDDAGDRQPMEPVVIGDLVREAADSAAGRRVTRVEPGAQAAVMLADKRRLEHVVTNLVENAEIYGGGCLEVSVSLSDRRTDGDWITLRVDDTGPGVPPGQRDRIFERFARGTNRPGPGVGLGLAIVARHVQWHGGQVEVRDRPGGGARFCVTLPTNVRRPRSSRTPASGTTSDIAAAAGPVSAPGPGIRGRAHA